MSPIHRRGNRHLDLPRPLGAAAPAGPIVRRSRGRRRLRQRRLLQGATGLLLAALGTGILAALVRIPERLDTLLLVSNAVANVIGGLSRLGLGLLQLAGVLVVVVLALFALLLLAGGVVRLWKATVAVQGGPRPAASPPPRL
jgi:hypothetical protein